jgi:hypothetical protein
MGLSSSSICCSGKSDAPIEINLAKDNVVDVINDIIVDDKSENKAVNAKSGANLIDNETINVNSDRQDKDKKKQKEDEDAKKIVLEPKENGVEHKKENSISLAGDLKLTEKNNTTNINMNISNDYNPSVISNHSFNTSDYHESKIVLNQLEDKNKKTIPKNDESNLIF